MKLSEEINIMEALVKTHSIAVIGMKIDEAEAAFRVPLYLYNQGYKIYPVNPKFEGYESLGEKFVSKVNYIRRRIDLVDIFRRLEFIPEHVEEILSMNTLPKFVWFQLGIRNDEARKKLMKAGIKVIQDKCMSVEHRKLKISV
jgi:predicted CoA-binding protein